MWLKIKFLVIKNHSQFYDIQLLFHLKYSKSIFKKYFKVSI